MASVGTIRGILLPAIATCALVGGYAGMYSMSVNGLMDTMKSTAMRPVDPYVPGGVSPFRNKFTGVALIDGWLNMLVPFFAFALDTPHSWAVTASGGYLLTAYFGACCLLFLEGSRRGNAGRSVSWVGTLLMICQSITYTVTAPFYFILHILTSPTAATSVSVADVLPGDQSEPGTLLLSTLIAYVIPTVGMALPAPSLVSAAAHYNWIAAWQPFPVYYAVLQWVLVRAFPSRGVSGGGSKLSTAVVYRTVIGTVVTAHLALLAVALTPSSVVPAGWPTVKGFLDEVTLQSAVIPPSLFDRPTVNPKLHRPGDLAPLTHFFLNYDLWCGSTALLLWAAYLRRVASGPMAFSWSSVVVKSLGWTLVGGPVAAAAALLWERDETLVRRESMGGKKVR